MRQSSPAAAGVGRSFSGSDDTTLPPGHLGGVNRTRWKGSLLCGRAFPKALPHTPAFPFIDTSRKPFNELSRGHAREKRAIGVESGNEGSPWDLLRPPALGRKAAESTDRDRGPFSVPPAKGGKRI